MTLTAEMHSVSEKVAAAVRSVLPVGFRGKFTINVLDSQAPLPHDVSVEFRPPQPKAGMAR